MDAMDASSEIREFLRSRRAKITPEATGLPVYGGANRRVKGLRREEVAMLAGVSVDYYTQLERGRLSGVSDQVLASLAQALQLDEAETAHLHDLARAANSSSSTRRRTPAAAVRPTVERMLDAMVDAPGWVRNERFDLLASNALGRALYEPVLAMSGRVNTARFTFLEPAARTFFRDWSRTADDCVATLRGSAGRNPFDKALTDLVGELSTRSPEFRTRWAAHDVRFHRTGLKRLHHPVVGDLDLTYEALELPADPGLTMLVYGAEPDSPTADLLRLLGSLAATSADPATVEAD